MAKRKAKNKLVAKSRAGSNLTYHRHGIKIAHHSHSGRHLPWHFTNYAFLYFLLILTAFLILFASNAVKADQQTAQGSIMLTTTVNGAPPAVGATITSPQNNAHLSDRTVPVSGTCTKNLFVEVYRNNSFAGQDLCDSNNSFEVLTTLVPGENKLVAKIKDGAGQYGPDSNLVIVFYDVPSSSHEGPSRDITNGNIAPFLLYTESAIHGLITNRKFTLTYEIDGGKPPYAISVNWGDGTNESVYSLSKDGDYIADHTYKFSGQFTVRISASDSLNTKAVIQTISIVNDANAEALVSDSSCKPVAKCLASSSFLLDLIDHYLWPALLIALLMTLSFWLGEKIVYGEERKRGKLKHA